MRSAAIQTARRRMTQVTVPLLDMVVPRSIVVKEVVATQTQEAPRKSLSALQLQTYPGDSIPAREGRRKKTLRNVSIQAWPPLPDTNEGIQVDPLQVS